MSSVMRCGQVMNHPYDQGKALANKKNKGPTTGTYFQSKVKVSFIIERVLKSAIWNM